MNEDKTVSIYRALDYEDFSKKMSLVAEDNKMTLDSGIAHLNYHSVIELHDFVIGVRHEISGLYPIVKTALGDAGLFIGVDNSLMLVSINEKKVTWRIELNTPFIGMNILTDSIVVIEEGGVSKWRYCGNRDWFCGTDLITSYKLIDGVITVSQMDTPDITISLDTGKPE